ncbi:uncharacterized protein LOC117646916 [Thrips palmi]|uniref:Uncharacterized protein LOC117646916 n=1 Tax=Thrips palmi TaxID=161013 RepID=A0A6P8Z371_THRPL|nr:uncharacterized protein LOC117646916 [Thrips palmi]XP_034244157.1 uncharacterized protein LOC117646916 [Thrips palmi]
MCKATLASMEKSNFIESVFKSEIFVYNRLLPALEEVAHLKNPLPWPRGYPAGSSSQSPCVVMEDMRPQGFGISERGTTLDEKRCRLLVTQLARFHGAGMVLDKQRPDLMAELKKIVDEPVWLEELKKVWRPFLKATVNTPDLIKDRFPASVIEKLHNICNTYTEDFFDYLLPDPEGGNTVVHGDCHVNNILFQTNEVGEAVGCCLIDFQIVRYAWPAPDLAIILLTTTEKKLRDEHWASLMRQYHDELQSTLRAGGIEDPDSVYPWHMFQKHMQRASRMAIGLVASFVHAFTDTSAIKDVQNTLADVTNNGEAKNSEVGVYKIKDSPEVRRRFGDAVQSVLDWGWL